MKKSKPYDLSSGIIPVLRTPMGIRFLLLRVYQNWDFPKGLVEAGEAPLVAAIRELEEETGLTEVEFPWGEDYVETKPYSYGKVARYYLGEVSREDVVMGINPALGRPEHHEYRWMDAEEAHRESSPRVRIILEWACDRLNGMTTRNNRPKGHENRHSL